MSDKTLHEVLRTRRSVMTQREVVFADGLLQFHKDKGYWSDKQLDGARKLAVRLITERDGND